ncbi:MAG: KxYKxGKxW signal peptide domain-containing protein [Lacticaseibacillus songhuajiangensis]|jgi:LPXTG-motif cell wall-anchored protein|nr:KxYKxGKxW signal peptide domain-containing protein [Lacticaseibacillus songhuajiangensis]
MEQEYINRHERRLRAEAERKTHYKMYKAGKRWTIAGVTLLSLGMVTYLGQRQTVAAATDDTAGKQDTSDATSSKTITLQTSAADAAHQQVTDGTTTANGTTEPSATGSQQSLSSDANYNSSNGQAQTSTDGGGTTASTPQPTAMNEQQSVVDENDSNSSADDTAVNQHATPAPPDSSTRKTAAATQNTQDIKDAVSVSASAVKTTAAAGEQAGFKVNVDTTGIKTTLHHAKLTLNLPSGDGVQLASDPQSLAISGVTPTLDAATGTLSYDFGNLDSGISASVVLGMTTSAATGAASSLTLSGQLTSDEATIDIPNQTIQLEAEAQAGVTNSVWNVVNSEDPSPNHVNPIAGDTINFNFGAWIPTSEGGSKLLMPGSTVQVVYAMSPDLDYVGMVSGDGKVTAEPSIVVASDGYKILTWKFVAGSIAEQEAASPTYNFIVQAKVADNTADYAPELTQAKISGTTDDGRPIASSVASANFTVSPYSATDRIVQNGAGFGPNFTYNTADGNGNAAADAGTDPDPTVEIENDPILTAHTAVTSGGPGEYSPSNTLRYLALHVLLDPNTVLQNVTLAKGYYYPNPETAPTTLTDPPYATLAVKYAGEGVDTYHVLKGDINTAVKHSFNRADLIAMGLNPNQAVVNLYIYYHNTANPAQNIPANVDTFYKEVPDGPDHVISIPDYTGFPDDADVVNGFFQDVTYSTSIAPGYTGPITSQAYGQFDDADTFDEAPNDKDGSMQWWTHYLAPTDNSTDPTIVANSSPAHVEVVHAAQGVTRDVSAQAKILAATATNGVTTGANTLNVNFTLGDNSLANLTTDSEPFSAYILLPAGVGLSAEDQSGATVVNSDYNGSGQELVKASWNSYMVKAGQTLDLNIGVDITADAPASLPIKTYIDLGAADYELTAIQDGNIASATKVTDTQDINGNGSAVDQLIEINNLYNISKTSQVETSQKIVGTDALADGTPSTKVGSQATIVLSTAADTDAKISALDLLDVLPRASETGLTTTDSRTADYQFKLAGPVSLPAAWDGKVAVTYSSAAEPDESDPSQWQNADAVSDWTQITAFRLNVPADSGIVVAGGSQNVTFVVNAPTNVNDFTDEQAKLADNSYSLRINGLQKTEPHAATLAIEPVAITNGTYTSTRTIHYLDAAGNTLRPDTVQTLTYRTATSNLTGQTIYTPVGAYAQQVAPLVAGYTAAADVSQKLVGATVTAPQNSDVTVEYTHNQPTYGIFATTRTIHYRYADGKQAAPDAVQTVNYKTTTDPAIGATVYTPAGIYAAQESPTILGYEADIAEVALQTVGASGATPQNSEVTVTYTGDAVSHGAYSTTRTIHYRYADGATAVPDVVQVLTYKTTTDLKTGKVVYTPQGFYLEQSTPLLSGYVADITQIGAEVKVASSTTPQDEVVTVTFSRGGSNTLGNLGGNTPTTTPGTPDGNTSTTTPGKPSGNTETTTTTPDGDLPDTYDDGDTPSTTTGTGKDVTPTPTPKQTANTATGAHTPGQGIAQASTTASSDLPQTGDNNSQTLSIIGFALAYVLGLFGLGVKKRREE